MAQKKKKEETLEAPYKLKVLFTIIDRDKRNFYLDVLEGYEINFQTVLYGHGTAPSELYHYLGINNDKAIIISVVRDSVVKEILNNYEDKYFKTKKGKGIAFTLEMTSLIGVSLYKFLANQQEEELF